MNKVPVGQTIGQSYRFAFGKYLTLLGITWLPLLIMSAVGMFVFVPVFKEYIAMMPQLVPQPGTPPSLPPGFGSIMGRFFLVDFLFILIYLTIRVGIAKEILGLRTGPRFLYISLGAAELRVIAGYILAFLLVYVLVVVTVILLGIAAVAGGLAGGAFPPHPGAGGPGHHLPAIAVALVFAIEFLFLYGLIRLTFFIVPVAVVEKRMGIFRSWELTSGNFWRIFGITLGIWVPMLIVELIVFAFTIGPRMAAMIAAAHNGQAPDMRIMMDAYLDIMPYFFLGGIVFMPILYGLIGSPSVFAYRALAPAEPAM